MSEDEFIIPDVIEAAVGWRAWVVKSGLLYSVRVRKTFWSPDEWTEAKCLKSSHEPPELHCSCGLYAAMTFEHLAHQGYQRYTSNGDVIIAGQVYLKGNVIECTAGYRAQYGLVKKLWVPHRFWKIGNQVAETYQVPMKLVNTIEELESV